MVQKLKWRTLILKIDGGAKLPILRKIFSAPPSALRKYTFRLTHRNDWGWRNPISPLPISCLGGGGLWPPRPLNEVICQGSMTDRRELCIIFLGR